jgi:hypothetical protein
MRWPSISLAAGFPVVFLKMKTAIICGATYLILLLLLNGLIAPESRDFTDATFSEIMLSATDLNCCR